MDRFCNSAPDRCVSVRGFTLIELVIVLAIMGFIASITLAGSSSFNRSIALSEQAHRVANILRQAQSLGYGFHIDYNSGPTATLIMFEDFNPGSSSCFDDTSNPNFQPGNCTYESYMDYGTRGTELVKEFHLDSGPSITKFCLDDNQEVCTDGGGGDLIALDVAFSRANSAANLIGYAPNGGQYFPLSVIFHIKGFGEGEKCVVIRRSGQISIPQICP